MAGGGGDVAGIYQRLILRERPQAAIAAWGHHFLIDETVELFSSIN